MLHSRRPGLFSSCENSYIFKQLQKQCSRETMCSLQNRKKSLSGSFRKTYANLCPRVTRRAAPSCVVTTFTAEHSGITETNRFRATPEEAGRISVGGEQEALIQETFAEGFLYPVFLPGKSHGQRSLVGYSPWGQRVGHG